MRNYRAGAVVCVLSILIACGGFGADDEEELPPPGTPEGNAQPPPVDGKPVPGIYVSSSKGDDSGSGSPVRPLKTLKAAFALAKQQGLRVIACAEAYEGNVEVLDGVSAYGYYDCNVDPWKQAIDRRAVVKAPASPALVAKGIRLPTRLEGFEIIAPNLDGAPAASPELGSSIAASIRESAGLAFGQMTFRAGNGAPGAPGAPPAANNVESGSPSGSASVAQSAQICMLAICGRISGAVGGTSLCADGVSGGPGGVGGDGKWNPYGAVGQPNHAGRPFAATATTAVGGAASSDGTKGNPGLNGPNGEPGVWKVEPETGSFIPGDGAAGTIGGPGQGGGGGGGSSCWTLDSALACAPSPPADNRTATGGGGGAGGCGGLPGTGGKGGGASIGVLLVSSDVVFADTQVFAATGGAAGKGGAGLDGLAGGTGGADTRGRPPPVGLPGAGWGGGGGKGGQGGTGGYGAHGTAGPSIALLFHGQPPVSQTQTLHLVPGSGGAGQPEISRMTPSSVLQKLPAAPAGESIVQREF